MGDKADGRDGRQGRRKVCVGDAGKIADDHVLRIPGQGRGAADIRRHGDGEQIRDRVAFQPHGDVEDQRRHDQADGVVDQKRRERSGNKHNGDQQHDRISGTFDEPFID